MSVTSSPRSTASFNGPRAYHSQVRPHHTAAAPPPPAPSQIYYIPPTPDGQLPSPGAAYPHTTTGTSSPASGYFGLAKDEDDSHISANWSAGSSLHSAAARSP